MHESYTFRNKKLLEFFQKNVPNLNDVFEIESKNDLLHYESISCKVIFNQKLVNEYRFINKHFEFINKNLENKAIFISRVETYSNRRKKILKKYNSVLAKIIIFLDFIFNRLFPKLTITKKLYFFITKGKYRVLSRAETFGRLYACGFEIIDQKKIDNHLFFAARKISIPSYDQNPTYGFLIKLKRVGKHGKIFNAYKLRTMHPYSEYLQEFLYNRNKLSNTGKIMNDFRLSPEAKILRKYWIDEMPMLINILKGDMKIVGVRPISEHYFNLYDDDLKNRRKKNKPGFIPPYYVDLPKNFKEIMESEMKYFEQYDIVLVENYYIVGVRPSQQ